MPTDPPPLKLTPEDYDPEQAYHAAGPFSFSAAVPQPPPPAAGEPPAPDTPPGLRFLGQAVEPDGVPTPVGLIDAHLHTPFCKHARGDLAEYAHAALELGLSGVTVTCHNPLPDGHSPDIRMAEDQLDAYADYVDRGRRDFEGRLDVRLGIEADYVPGFEKELELQLTRHPFDFVLGSIHPQLDEYKAKYYHGNTYEFQQTYFKHLADSAETGLFDSLSHPDLVKHLMPTRWSVSKIMSDICHALDRIARTGVAMELNTSGWRRPVAEACPGPLVLYEMARRRIPVTLGSDAHAPSRVGERFGHALRLLEAAGYRRVSLFQQRQRIDLPIDRALAQLREPRPMPSPTPA
jgi:histidinol-phosphatase (PHP family)